MSETMSPPTVRIAGADGTQPSVLKRGTLTPLATFDEKVMGLLQDILLQLMTLNERSDNGN